MPRQLFFNKHIMDATKASFGAAATFLLLCALTLMACVSHSRRWRCFMAARRQSSESVISIQQVLQPGVDEYCIWQKSILMGEKCQLPDFSGIITYDSAGNLVAPGRPHATYSLK